MGATRSSSLPMGTRYDDRRGGSCPSDLQRHDSQLVCASGGNCRPDVVEENWIFDDRALRAAHGNSPPARPTMLASGQLGEVEEPVSGPKLALQPGRSA